MSYVVQAARDPSARVLRWDVWGYAPTFAAGQQVVRSLGGGRGFRLAPGGPSRLDPAYYPSLVPIYLTWHGHRYFYGLYKPSPTLAILDAIEGETGGVADRATAGERMAKL